VGSPPVRRAAAAAAVPPPLPTRAWGTAHGGRRREAQDTFYGYFDVAHHDHHQPSNRSAHNTADTKGSNRATQTALRDTRTTEHSHTPIGSP